MLVEQDQPLIWRGSMLHSSVNQFCHQVSWGELDVLVVDIPPGTGDVQLSLSQIVPVDAALLVGRLSDIFPQDIEDMDLHGESTDQKRYYTDQDGTISTAQAKRIYAIAKGEKSLINPVMEKYGYKKSEEIKKTDYDAICAEVTKNREAYDKMAESGE